jgi:hypothetical protein
MIFCLTFADVRAASTRDVQRVYDKMSITFTSLQKITIHTFDDTCGQLREHVPFDFLGYWYPSCPAVDA